MEIVDLKFIPIATIHFTEEEVASLAIAASKHRDSSCRSLIQEGGLIFEMARVSGPRGTDKALYEDEVNKLLRTTRQDQVMTTNWEIKMLHERLLEIAKQLELAFNKAN